MLNLVRIFLLTLSFAIPELSAKELTSLPKVIPSAKKVILISWDGLRPDFFLKSEFETPNLRKIITQGVVVERLTAIFPSLTYPSHASLVTGVRPGLHGVLSNTVFQQKDGTNLEWYWDAKYIHARTLWQAARDKGKTVAILRWPVSRGADVDWLVPEVFSVPGVHGKSDREVVEKSISSELRHEFAEYISAPLPRDDLFEPFDVWNIQAASYLHKKYHPDLTLIHLCNVDHVQHETGAFSLATKSAVKRMDAQLAELLKAVDLMTTCLLIVGDHGHADFSKTVHINNLFRDKGWITEKDGKVKDWKVIAHVSGSQSAIYIRDKALVTQVRTVLNENAGDYFEIIEKPEMLKMSIYPDAEFAVPAKAGTNLSGQLSNEFVQTNGKIQSTHGYLSTVSEMDTIFIGVGCGIKPGQKLKQANLLQVAPTIAKLLGVTLPKAEKKAFSIEFN